MKKSLTCLLFLFTNVCMAQAPIIDSTVVILEGESVQIGQVYNALNVDTGLAGAQQIFDYSVIPAFNTNITISGVNNAQSPLGANFPQANATVLWTGAGNPYYNFELTANAYTYLGGGSSFINYVYTDFYEQLHFPFTYMDSYSDSFAAVSNTNGHRAGYSTITADGWGTLILPNQTIDNVLRIKRITTYNDTVNNNPRVSNETYFEYYKIGYKHYLLMHGFYTITTQGSSPVSGSQLFVNNSVVTSTLTETSNLEFDVKKKRNNYYEINTPHAQTLLVKIYNTLGQTVYTKEEQVYAGKNHIYIENKYNQGIYFISFLNQQGQSVSLKDILH